jgi:tetratricopeptide (TPR) repeat protein
LPPKATCYKIVLRLFQGVAVGFPLPSWRGIKEFCHDCREWLGRWLLGRGREEEIERQLEKLERELEKERDPGKKAKLAEHVEDLQAAWRGILIAKTERLLRKEGYPPYGALVANGKHTLAPAAREELGMLVRAVAELEPPAALPRVLQLMLSATAKHVLKRYEEALADWNRALELKPDDPEILNNRGVTYHDLGRYDEALADYNRALELRPDDPETLCNRGAAYNRLDRYDDALADLNRAIILKPRYRQGIGNRGNSYFGLKRYKDAIAEYDRVLEMKPDDERGIGNRGMSYFNLGRYNEALADLNKAVQMSPHTIAYIGYRGNVYRKLKRYDDALADYNSVLKLKPDDKEAFYSMACLFSLMGSPELAILYLEKAIALDQEWRGEAATDRDFDNIRDDPRFRRLVGGT